MVLGKVIGHVSAVQKLDSLRGLTLVIVTPVNARGEPAGNTTIAVDPLGVGIGQRVLMITGGAAQRVLQKFGVDSPVDAAVVAIVDSMRVEEKA